MCQGTDQRSPVSEELVREWRAPRTLMGTLQNLIHGTNWLLPLAPSTLWTGKGMLWRVSGQCLDKTFSPHLSQGCFSSGALGKTDLPGGCCHHCRAEQTAATTSSALGKSTSWWACQALQSQPGLVDDSPSVHKSAFTSLTKVLSFPTNF